MIFYAADNYLSYGSSYDSYQKNGDGVNTILLQGGAEWVHAILYDDYPYNGGESNSNEFTLRLWETSEVKLTICY